MLSNVLTVRPSHSSTQQTIRMISSMKWAGKLFSHKW